jgi:hypothetical protein
MIVEAAKLDAVPYTVQYELLRSQVMGTVSDVAGRDTSGQRCGVSLALLLSEGMPGWLKNLEAVLRASVAPPAVDSPDPASRASLGSCSSAPTWLSSVQRHEVTTLLASLVLSTRALAR